MINHQFILIYQLFILLWIHKKLYRQVLDSILWAENQSLHHHNTATWRCWELNPSHSTSKLWFNSYIVHVLGTSLQFWLYTAQNIPTTDCIIWATTWQNQQNECAPSEDSDQPGHPPSLIRFFSCAQWVAKNPRFLLADSEDSDQAGRMPRLIWVFAGRTGTLLVLSCRGSIMFVC